MRLRFPLPSPAAPLLALPPCAPFGSAGDGPPATAGVAGFVGVAPSGGEGDVDGPGVPAVGATGLGVVEPGVVATGVVPAGDELPGPRSK